MTTPDFFCARLDAMIDLNHPLAILRDRFPWEEIEAILTLIHPCHVADRPARLCNEVDWAKSS